MIQGLHHCEFPEQAYDWEPLWRWYQTVQQHAVYFNDWMNSRLPPGAPRFRGSGSGFKLLDLEPLGRIVRDEPEINPLLRAWRFYPELADQDVDIIIYPPQYILLPHTDHYMGCGIMYPIQPAEPAGITFYRAPEGRKLEHSREYSPVPDRDTIYTHHYQRGVPTMFDGQIIHGVWNGDQERIFLRVKLRHQTFQSVCKMSEENSLFTV